MASEAKGTNRINHVCNAWNVTEIFLWGCFVGNCANGLDHGYMKRFLGKIDRFHLL